MLMKENKISRKIGILGAGKIGQALGQLWLRAGHEVSFGGRTPEKLVTMVEALGPRASAQSLKVVAAESEVILLAVPYSAVDECVASVSNELVGKIILDATNPVGFSPEGRIISTLANGTAGTRMAARLPNSTIVRVFTHVMDELLVSRATRQSGSWAVAIAGDSLDAKSLAEKLVQDTGFIPVDIGTLAESAPLDPGGILFPNMFTEADMRAVLIIYSKRIGFRVMPSH